MKQVCQPIYINGRFLTQGVTGVQRYARETLMAMDRLLAARADASGLSELTILAPAGAQRPALQHIGYREVGRLAGHLWEQTELAWHARDGLLFTFGFTGPLLHRHQITTVHDAAVVRELRQLCRDLKGVDRLIADLDSPRYQRREQATQRLLQMHILPETALQQAVATGSAEVRSSSPDRDSRIRPCATC